MDNWTDRCHKYTLVDGTTGFQINFAGMNFTDADIENMSKRFVGVHEEMLKIERGEIKNPDEHRKVTHFTDRSVYTGSEERTSKLSSKLSAPEKSSAPPERSLKPPSSTVSADPRSVPS